MNGNDSSNINHAECRSPGSGSCAFTGAVANLAVTAIGAGMLALPKAFSTVGIALGLTLTITVCFLTYFSSSVIIRYAARDHKDSYGSLIKNEFGRGGAAALQCAIIIHVLGVMIVYLIIIQDMLIGSAPDYKGLIPYFFGESQWFISRWLISLVLLVVVVCPMLISRDLSIVSHFSKFSVRMLLSLAATLVVLAGVAVARGKAAQIEIFPDFNTVGGTGGPIGLLSATLTVLAVLALAFTCQFNLVPVHNSMADNRTKTMQSATQASIALSALLYASIAIAGYTLFGSKTDGDVLKNLTIEYVTGCIGKLPAEILIIFVVGANTLNLLINFVLKVWAVRDAWCELALGKPSRALRAPAFYFVTGVLVSIAFAVSVVLPSVWFLVSLVGSTACVTFSYVFPGCLLFRRARTVGGKALGAGAVALAALMATVAVVNTLSGNAAG
jgi:amino acid permease